MAIHHNLDGVPVHTIHVSKLHCALIFILLLQKHGKTGNYRNNGLWSMLWGSTRLWPYGEVIWYQLSSCQARETFLLLSSPGQLREEAWSGSWGDIQQSSASKRSSPNTSQMTSTQVTLQSRSTPLDTSASLSLAIKIYVLLQSHLSSERVNLMTLRSGRMKNKRRSFKKEHWCFYLSWRLQQPQCRTWKGHTRVRRQFDQG